MVGQARTLCALVLCAAVLVARGAEADADAGATSNGSAPDSAATQKLLGLALFGTENFVKTAQDYGSAVQAAFHFLTSPEDIVKAVKGLPDRVEEFQQFAQAQPLIAATRVGIALLVLATFFLTKPRDVMRATGLSPAQQEDLIEDWVPEPLVPPAPQGTKAAASRRFVVEGHKTKTVRVRGVDGDLLNCASCDFLNFGAAGSTKRVSREALDKYTLGSCGPRGFYGTTDAHLSLEAAMASAFGCPETITYSDGTATVASAIPAFSKRSDVIFLDDGVNHAVQTGCTLSRSHIERFRHNDVADLERAVKSLCGKRASTTKRYFIVVEGLYANRGDICPLPDIVRIARRYHVRIILDDSMAFGVLGKRGLGTADHFGLEPLDVDVTLGSMATSMGSVGGFCVGNDEVVDHQRLSGAGYVFSASLPPFLCSTAQAAMEAFTSDPAICEGLRSNARTLRALLDESRGRFKVTSAFAESPVVHVRLAWHSDRPANDPSRIDAARAAARGPEEPAGPAAEWGMEPRRARPARRRFQGVEDDDLDRVIARAVEHGVLLARSRYLVTDAFAPANGIRVHVSAAMTVADLRRIAEVLEEAVEAAFEARSPVPVSPSKRAAIRRRRT